MDQEDCCGRQPPPKRCCRGLASFGKHRVMCPMARPSRFETSFFLRYVWRCILLRYRLIPRYTVRGLQLAFAFWGYIVSLGLVDLLN